MTSVRQPTSADVARLAGVSRGTVSNVLNGDVHQRVRPATARRVLDAAAGLGYVPSAAARHLRGGAARFVLVLAPSDFTQGVEGSRILDALARDLAPRDLGMIQLTGLPKGMEPASDLSPAVVLAVSEASDLDRVSRRFRVPVLPAFPGRDDHIRAAARAQIAYAASRGARRVVFVAPNELSLAAMARLRRGALESAAGDQGIELGEAATLGGTRADWTVQARSWLEEHGPGTWICAYNDDVALAVLAGAHDAGVRVPFDLSVVGADDTAAARRAVPALTSVRAELTTFVRALGNAVQRAAGGLEYEVPMLPTDLEVHVRDSTA